MAKPTWLEAEAAHLRALELFRTLNRTVNGIHNLTTNWKASPWQPTGRGLFYPLPPTAAGKVRVLSFHPTYREKAGPGIILYEILESSRQPEPVPVAIPEAEQQVVRQEVQRQSAGTAAAWARQFGTERPVLMGLLRGLVLVVGLAAAVAALLALFDPVPGDEVAAATAATALIYFAAHGTVPPELGG